MKIVVFKEGNRETFEQKRSFQKPNQCFCFVSEKNLQFTAHTKLLPVLK